MIDKIRFSMHHKSHPKEPHTILNSHDIGDFPGTHPSHCRYGMFNRHGGISSGLYASLNVGQHVGDRQEAIASNRQFVKARLAVPALLSAKQIHSDGIYCLTEPLDTDLEVDGFDALITDLPSVGLMIQQADCQAVLLFDPVKKVIGAVHCGWRGSVLELLQKVVALMRTNYGTDPANLQAIISPSLGPCCAEFVNHKSELPPEFQPFMARDNYFDFWQISRYQLVLAGLSASSVRITGRCTCCSDDFFSYRQAARQSGGLTGRNCSIIVL